MKGQRCPAIKKTDDVDKGPLTRKKPFKTRINDSDLPCDDGMIKNTGDFTDLGGRA